jgi:hypothetical protein
MYICNTDNNINNKRNCNNNNASVNSNLIILFVFELETLYMYYSLL